MYDESIERDFITYRDSRKANIPVSSSIVYKDSTTTILERECYMVKYNQGIGSSTTYYSDAVRVNYKTFKDHKVGNWYDQLKTVDGAIGLRTITEYETHYVIQEAVSVTERPVEQSEFALPTDKIIVASYSALDKNVELSHPSQEQINCYMEKVKAAVEQHQLTEPHTTYLSFIVTKKGEIKRLEALEEDDLGLHEVALDILTTCDIKFIPGEINKRPVSSFTYFPIKFE